MLPILEALPAPLNVRLSGDLRAEAMSEQLAPLRSDTSSCAYVLVECAPDVQLRPAGVGLLYATLLNVIRQGTPLLFVGTPKDTERTIRSLISRIGAPHRIVFASNEAGANAARQRFFLRIQLGLRVPLRVPNLFSSTLETSSRPLPAAA